ncbi:hypothetical protein DSM3645_03318 [Blastopirellula marina DSM 3645]|uniref:Uncharacterized protein n=1 Tax=Blastopirellula marina DSM 3645 TaxID=314230 RepID=A3ZVX7_9BACT|nr:hypothetical protein DSM3645_03318 [Blastopirellula marina DSM 3645]
MRRQRPKSDKTELSSSLLLQGFTRDPPSS